MPSIPCVHGHPLASGSRPGSHSLPLLSEGKDYEMAYIPYIPKRSFPRSEKS